MLGLGVAEMLLFYADVGVGYACQHMAVGFPEDGGPGLFEPWYNPFRADGAGGIIDMPTYQVTDLFARSVRARTVPLAIPGNPEGTGLVGDEPFDYPMVHAVAFAGEEDGALIGLNRQVEGPLPVRLRLPEGWTLRAATQWAPAALDLDAKIQRTEAAPLPFDCTGTLCDLLLAPYSVFSLVAGPASGG